jgi:hypothetical protein
MTSLNVPIDWVAFVLREVPASKLGPEAGYPDRFIRGSSHTFQKKNMVTYRPSARQRRDKLNSRRENLEN